MSIVNAALSIERRELRRPVSCGLYTPPVYLEVVCRFFFFNKSSLGSAIEKTHEINDDANVIYLLGLAHW